MTARETDFSLASSSADLTFSGAEAGSRSAGTLEPGEMQTTLNFSTTASGDADTTSNPLTPHFGVQGTATASATRRTGRR